MVKVEGNLIKTYTKYFQYAMVLDQSDGSKWKPQNKMVKDQSKKKSTASLTRRNGTLRGVFSMKHGKETQHFFPGSKPHICHSPTLVNGEMIDTRVQLLLIVPPSLWNIDNLLIDKMKEALSNVPSKSWIGQTNCRVSRQYLKELSSASNLKMVCQQA